MIVDLSFTIRGKSVPLDHGYALFGAVSRLLPVIHEQRTWGIHPVAGTRVGPGILGLTPRSRLTVRAPASDIERLLPLSGKELELDGHRIVVGTPNVLPLRPVTSLRSRFVTIKGGNTTPEAFLELATKAIAHLAEECADLREAKLKVGERRVMRIASHRVVGYAADVEVQPEASLFLQAKGLGGRRHMGAGLFIPSRS
jgi:CRISPR-associated protein Cas6